MPAETATEPEVGYETAKLVAGTPGATVDASRGEAGRTAEEKQEALDESTDKTAGVEQFKTMYELAGGSTAEMQACLQQIIFVLERHLNIDFVREAPLTEVTAGIAHQRAAMSPGKESPQLVDDVVVPPGVNNAGDEVLPPNLLEGSEDAKELGFTAGDTRPLDEDEVPNKSATREDWDAYAERVGVDPTQYASKEELQAAVEEHGSAAS